MRRKFCTPDLVYTAFLCSFTSMPRFKHPGNQCLNARQRRRRSRPGHRQGSARSAPRIDSDRQPRARVPVHIASARASRMLTDRTRTVPHYVRRSRRAGRRGRCARSHRSNQRVREQEPAVGGEYRRVAVGRSHRGRAQERRGQSVRHQRQGRAAHRDRDRQPARRRRPWYRGGATSVCRSGRLWRICSRRRPRRHADPQASALALGIASVLGAGRASRWRCCYESPLLHRSRRRVRRREQVPRIRA